MTTSCYYNENDSFAAAWLRELVKAGLIASGDVDERSISDVDPADLAGYTQCHFFAGIGGWSYALRLAGWPDDAPVWTGSCPCQPFSAAGKRTGTTDSRHLWPEWFRLISKCRPDTVFGEQVASKDGLQWLDLVHADLEGAGYAVGAADLCAAGVGAPHIRQRLYFVGDSGLTRAGWNTRAACSSQEGLSGSGDSDGRGSDSPVLTSTTGELADSGSQPAWRGLCRSAEGLGTDEQRPSDQFERPSVTGSLLGHSEGSDGQVPVFGRGSQQKSPESRGPSGLSFWSPCDWLPCIDGKARPVEPGTFPLAHGVPARVGRLRGYGNAIVPQVAQAFIEAYLIQREFT